MPLEIEHLGVPSPTASGTSCVNRPATVLQFAIGGPRSVMKHLRSRRRARAHGCRRPSARPRAESVELVRCIERLSSEQAQPRDNAERALAENDMNMGLNRDDTKRDSVHRRMSPSRRMTFEMRTDSFRLFSAADQLPLSRSRAEIPWASCCGPTRSG
jgi:hypothetical protein